MLLIHWPIQRDDIKFVEDCLDLLSELRRSTFSQAEVKFCSHEDTDAEPIDADLFQFSGGFS